MTPNPPAGGHAALTEPSLWVRRWAAIVGRGGPVLDVACGGGRHARLFAALGHPVDAVDRDAGVVSTLAGVPGITALCADIEGGQWPYGGRTYVAVVVTNYLHRPLFPHLLAALAPGGILIYETFAVGNEAYGRPANPDFLLRPRELLETVGQALHVQAYEHGYVERPKPAVIQRICAIRTAGLDVDQKLFFPLNS